VKTVINLDYECMKCSQAIINHPNIKGYKTSKELENTLRTALGILKEDGVYAMFLWIASKEKGEEIRKIIIKSLNGSEIITYILDNSGKFPEDFNEFCEKLKEVAQDINKLLFLKKFLERTLIYALYHARAGE